MYFQKKKKTIGFSATPGVDGVVGASTDLDVVGVVVGPELAEAVLEVSPRDRQALGLSGTVARDVPQVEEVGHPCEPHIAQQQSGGVGRHLAIFLVLISHAERT